MVHCVLIESVRHAMGLGLPKNGISPATLRQSGNFAVFVSHAATCSRVGYSATDEAKSMPILPGEHSIFAVVLRIVMAALWNRAGHYIFALWFLFSIFFFSSPNLSRRRLDVCHTSTHGVALVRISDAGLKRAAHGSLQIQDAKKSPKIKSPSAHHRATLSGDIFATKARVDNRKLLSSNISSRCPHNMVNFGPLVMVALCNRADHNIFIL